MVLEVSGNYSIILPVILANTIAYLLSRTLQPLPIFEVLTHQNGLDLPSMEEQREESNLHLEDAMEPVTAPVLQGSEAVGRALHLLSTYQSLTPEAALLIHCPDRLWYATRRQDLEEQLATVPAEDRLSDQIGPERIPILFPDLPLASALPTSAAGLCSRSPTAPSAAHLKAPYHSRRSSAGTSSDDLSGADPGIQLADRERTCSVTQLGEVPAAHSLKVRVA